MFESILIASDGSTHAQRAVEAGCQLALKFGSRVAIVHTVGHGQLPAGLRQMAEVEHLVEPSRPRLVAMEELPRSLVATGGADLDPSETYRTWHAIGQNILHQAVDIAKVAKISANGILSDGDPGECILHHADEVGADLIVMGRRGVSNLKGLLLGSVSQKVCQRSKVACLTVV